MEGGTNRYNRYQDLFAAPTGLELEAKFQKLAGGGYSTMHPTLAALADAASSSTLRSDSEAAKDICDASVRFACVHTVHTNYNTHNTHLRVLFTDLRIDGFGRGKTLLAYSNPFHRNYLTDFLPNCPFVDRIADHCCLHLPSL